MAGWGRSSEKGQRTPAVFVLGQADTIPVCMSIWGRHSLPELERFEGKAAQREAFKKAYWRVWKSGCNWLKVILISVVFQLALQLLARLVIRNFGFNEQTNLIQRICVGTGGGLTGLWLWIIARKSMIQNLRAMLNADGNPTCMTCGYDLRTQFAEAVTTEARPQESGRCPECGDAFAMVGK